MATSPDHQDGCAADEQLTLEVCSFCQLCWRQKKQEDLENGIPPGNPTLKIFVYNLYMNMYLASLQ